jgi:hypothetical protein
MTAIVVNYLHSIAFDAGVAVLYCSYMQQKQVREQLLAGLLRQLVHQQHYVSENVQALHTLCEKARRSPTFEELSSLLQHTAGTYSRLFIVIDALDECPTAERLALMSEIQRLQEFLPGIRFMATFRPHLILDNNFAHAEQLEIRADDSDLRHYVNCNISMLSPRVEETPWLKEAVVERITLAADGM